MSLLKPEVLGMLRSEDSAQHDLVKARGIKGSCLANDYQLSIHLFVFAAKFNGSGDDININQESEISHTAYRDKSHKLWPPDELAIEYYLIASCVFFYRSERGGSLIASEGKGIAVIEPSEAALPCLAPDGG